MPPDDYIHCNITQKQDWIDLYATPYYFGCEADDRMNAVAFGKAMPLGARINAIYSSDVEMPDVGAVDRVDSGTQRHRLAERHRVHPVVGLAAEVVRRGVEVDPFLLLGDVAVDGV